MTTQGRAAARPCLANFNEAIMDITSIDRTALRIAQCIGQAAPAYITKALGYTNAVLISNGVTRSNSALVYGEPWTFYDKPAQGSAKWDTQTLAQACLDAFREDHECWEFVGGGYFSGVVRHIGFPGVVFKISMRPDDAYKAYALWVRQNPGKHFPVIYSIHHVGDVAVYALKEYDHITMLPDFSTWEFLDRERMHRPNHVYRRSLCSAVGSVRKFFKGVAQLDIHGENLMFDPETKQVIITDPVSFNKEGDYNVAEPS